MRYKVGDRVRNRFYPGYGWGEIMVLDPDDDPNDPDQYEYSVYWDNHVSLWCTENELIPEVCEIPL